MTMEITWLDTLEEKVHLATEKIRELTEENAKLRTRLEESDTPSDPSEWQAEKDAIRERVEKLAAGLESLLGDE